MQNVIIICLGGEQWLFVHFEVILNLRQFPAPAPTHHNLQICEKSNLVVISTVHQHFDCEKLSGFVRNSYTLYLHSPFNPTFYGGGHNDPPCQLWSLTAPNVRHGLVQYPYEFGHMGGHCDPDPKKISKSQQCLSYASCDEMIKNSPQLVGLNI